MRPIHFWEEFLPNQLEYSKLAPFIHLPNFCNEAALFEFICNFNGFSDYSDLDLEVPENTPITTMASNPITIQFLQFLIRTNDIKSILEIGTYIGISAIKMALVAPLTATIFTIEKGEEFAKLARANFKRYIPYTCPIELYNDDALPILDKFFAQRDLIFLDADKENYDKYLEKLVPLLAPGGFIVVDDVLFHGDVLNKEPTTAKGKGCKRLLEAARTLPLAKVLLPLANGILLLRKPLT